ncbi:cytochrome P450 [Micromonospora sp. WMMA1363]|uniref:cytochrome P450 n=1 Tax=Micromonospora sp. WMMA1363 TaxID=3053985 RepID=UPI00259C73A8|nr:cytochrome P450 [Micromonospora sp. WMMA1363]MDM4719181.1 cytochrome P450 [Micromonospora sp. WMMA1363]
MPAWRALPSVLRDAHRTFVDVGNWSNGDVVRIGLGVSRPYLVTNPAHVHEVLQQKAAIYPRGDDTAMWRSVRKFVGDGILAEGATWAASRRTLAPLFRPTRINAMVDAMADAIAVAVDELDASAATAIPIDVGRELSRIVCGVITRTFFAGRITVEQALTIMAAQETIVTAMAPRILAPFVPWWLPMPGDRRFRDAVRAIDDILLPVLRGALREPGDGDDLLSALARGRTEDGDPLSEKQMRDDLVSMVAVATETSYVALTWLWPVLANHPDVASKLYDEIERVVGAGPVRADHLPALTYTKMVLEELLRLYPAGWFVPRRAAADDVLGGVRIDKGATVILSPYATQRMTAWWGPTAELFDPERFAPGRAAGGERHRYAHYPFGVGMHRCLGEHLFNLEAVLIVATLLNRFRFTVTDPSIPRIKVAGSLRPARRVEMILIPVERSATR